MVRKIIKEASQKLQSSDSPVLDARVLLAKAMGKSDASLIFTKPTESELTLFNEFVKKRASGIPVAYILGEKEFMGLCFKLNEDTLIPRPDTECLVEKVIEKNKVPSPRILDLCTGSGCIGISLAKYIENSFAELTDIAPGALCAAEENAFLNDIEERTDVYKLDVLCDDLKGGYDIIVSNPPYIESDILKNLEVSKTEPLRALDGGEDGLNFYRVIARKAYDALDSGGMLALEIGYNQGKSVKALLFDYSNVELFKDYADNDRVIIAIK